MIYIVILGAIFLYNYIHRILKNRLDRSRIIYVIDEFYMTLDGKNSETIHSLVKFMPRIESEIYCMDYMNYIDPPEDLEYKARRILSQLLARVHELEYEYPKTWSPFYALLKVFLLPSQILAWFGVNLNVVMGKIWSLVIWVIIILFKDDPINVLNNIWEWFQSFLV